MSRKQYLIVIGLVLFILSAFFFMNKFQTDHKSSETKDTYAEPTPVTAQPLDVTAAVSLTDGNMVSDEIYKIKYKWETGPDWEPPRGTPLVFVHLQDENGVKLCQDDHTPPVPVKNWAANQAYEYERILYIPITLLKRQAYLLIGIYNDQDHGLFFSIKGLQKYNPYYRYLAREFELLPSRRKYSETLIKYTSGWYRPELDDKGEIARRWMKQKGICELVNPKTEAYLFINAWIPNMFFESPAQITISLAGTKLVVPAPENDNLIALFDIPAAQVGPADKVELVIETDNIYNPSDRKRSDQRELGILVKKIIFREKSQER
ncbi:hypothetical protein ACFL27_03540 [candidate division CSSED10-310 bacterium]|uniref:Uncharacterized protein n=1 Tax=candidate division CSSED10-310 bacterium TaxID=2855610 RepID=A0ABV6YSU8_UNCC1